MIVNPGVRRFQAGAAGQLPPWSYPEVLDYWDARTGITQGTATERVSAWAAKTGSHSLDQGTAGNQPILLPFTGTNYLWLPGVAGNTASTPNAAQNRITGDLDIRVYLALKDWTNVGNPQIIGKWGATDAGYRLVAWSDGTLLLDVSLDGASNNLAFSTVATGITDNTAKWIRATRATASGDVNFYLSDDGNSWTKLGATVSTTLGAGFASTRTLFIGDSASEGKIYRAQLYNGINGTLVFDANFTAVAEGATTFTESSSNAATVTINSTGAKPAQIVGSQQILCDGTAHFLQALFTLNQPNTTLAVFKQVTWTSNHYLFDGGALNTQVIQQATGSPQIKLYAGSSLSNSSDFTLGTYKVLGAVVNGASSQYQANLGTAVTGNAGANNAGGLTVGASGDGSSSFGNIQVKAAVVCNSALSQARLNQLIRSMMHQYNVRL